MQILQTQQPKLGVNVRRILWRGEKLELIIRPFAQGRETEVLLLDDTKFPHIRVSLNSRNMEDLNPNEIIVKDYGENEGIKQVLVNAKLLIPTGRWVVVDNQLCEVCQIKF